MSSPLAVIISYDNFVDIIVVKYCSAYNEKSEYVAILVEIVNSDLKTIYGGSFLIQVWSKGGKKVYEKILKCKHTMSDGLDEPRGMNIFKDGFLFRLHKEEESSGFLYLVDLRKKTAENKDEEFIEVKIVDIANDDTCKEVV